MGSSIGFTTTVIVSWCVFQSCPNETHNGIKRGRSCFVRQANSDEELDQRIYALGDFGKIMSAAKRRLVVSISQSKKVLDRCQTYRSSLLRGTTRL